MLVGFEDYLMKGFDAVKYPYGAAKIEGNDIILDKEKLPGNNQWFSVIKRTETEVSSQVSHSRYEVEKEINSKCGIGANVKGVKCSVDISGSYKNSYTQNTIYAVTVVNVIDEFYSIDKTTDLSIYLTDEFVKFVKENKAPEIFKKYGTHLITAIYTGGSMQLKAITKENSRLTEKQVEADMAAGYRMLNVQASVGDKESVEELNEECTLNIKVKGGDLGKRPSGFLNDDNNIKEWQASVKDAPVVYSVVQVIPIWELGIEKNSVQEIKIHNKLLEGYYDYMRQHLAEMRDNIPYITSLRVVILDTDQIEKFKQEEEYVVKWDSAHNCENADLNKGSGGKYIYLCYRMGKIKKEDKKIIDLKLECLDIPTDRAVKLPYKHVPGDLNQSVGGAYIYLDYRLGKSADDGGYQALGVRNCEIPFNDNWELITDFEKNPVDLNKGARGEYIYLFGYRDPLRKEIKKAKMELEKYTKKTDGKEE